MEKEIEIARKIWDEIPEDLDGAVPEFHRRLRDAGIEESFIPEIISKVLVEYAIRRLQKVGESQ